MCLDAAARHNLPDLPCEFCQHHDNHVELTVSDYDHICCTALIVAALNPGSYTDSTPQNLITRLMEN
jgi:hypothetical protein